MLLTNLLYLLAALLGSPLWLLRHLRTGKLRTDWAARFARTTPRLAPPTSERPRLLLHAVSVGEVNAVASLVAELRRDCEVVIAATTDTGIRRATELYGETLPVVRYPFDFSWVQRRFLDAIAPDAVILVELEVWPNLARLCADRGLAMIVINGRISDRSFPKYQRVRALLRGTFARLSAVAAQDETCASRFAALGVDSSRITVIPTLKWDNARLHEPDAEARAAALAETLGIDRVRPLVVAGSTGPGEEALIRDAIGEAAQLLVAPRAPERFEEVAGLLAPCTRRSRPETGSGGSDRFLLDTIGELRAAYRLADLVIVGRSFCDLGGSDPIEPAALGKAVLIGPSVRNFDTVVRTLSAGGGLRQVTAEALPGAAAALLGDAEARREMGQRARATVEANVGSTARHAALIRAVLAHRK